VTDVEDDSGGAETKPERKKKVALSVRERAAKLGERPDKLDRVRFIKQMMALGEWIEGYWDDELGAIWSLSDSVIRADAAESSRALKDALADRDLASILVSTLMSNISEAKKRNRFEAVAQSCATIAKIAGIEGPTKHEHTGAAGAPIEIDARDALAERLAGLIASATSAGEASTSPSGSEPSGG